MNGKTMVLLLYILTVGISYSQTSCSCGGDTTGKSVAKDTVDSCCSGNPVMAAGNSCCTAVEQPAKLKLTKSSVKTDCGPWALGYIANKLGKVKGIEQGMKVVKYDKTKGASMQELAEGAKKLGLTAAGYKMSIRELEKRKFPVIVYFPDHFAVLTSIDPKLGQMKLIDSGKKQEYAMTREEFVQSWQGYVLEVSKANK
jgi:hypothetical protein